MGEAGCSRLSSAPGDISSCGCDVVLLLLLVAWPLCAPPAPGTEWLLAASGFWLPAISVWPFSSSITFVADSWCSLISCCWM